MTTLRVIAFIDRGGFGNVEIVEDERGHRYARKTFSQNQPLSEVLLKNVLKRFDKEVRVQSSIQHPNIVPIVGHDLTANPPYYLMPLATSSLAKDLQADRTLGGAFLSALSDIVAGLEEMHSMQIYHRDLKPQNVLRFASGDGGAQQSYYALSDFGLISMKESQLSSLTSTGMARQSDYYTAPEITKDLRYASTQSDIYSLGCILHDMVGTDDRIPCGEIREGGPFAAILLGCTRKDPKTRFKSAKAVLDAVLSVDSASHPAPTQKTTDFIAILESGQPLTPLQWKEIADFLEYEASSHERRAVFMNLSVDRIAELCLSAPEHANRIALQFGDWIQNSSFQFEYCDALANRLEALISSTDFEAKVACLMAMLEMGTSHNRWYVERKFAALCGAKMDSNLAKRLAVEFRISGEDICASINHLEGSIEWDRKNFHPVLVGALSEICK
jgi:eukaryotic-like serine/threonine-protein kinase